MLPFVKKINYKNLKICLENIKKNQKIEVDKEDH